LDQEDEGFVHGSKRHHPISHRWALGCVSRFSLNYHQSF
jgi:hypothetical protein